MVIKAAAQGGLSLGGGGEEMGIDRRERVPPVQRRGERGSGMSYGVITGGPGLHTR